MLKFALRIAFALVVFKLFFVTFLLIVTNPLFANIISILLTAVIFS